MTVSDIMKAIEGVAPLRLQEEYDNAGLQVGFPDGQVESVLVCLDITEAIVDEAIARNCQMVVSHHPLIFRPLKQVSDATWQQRCVTKALMNGIALYSAHTNLDNARGGVNFEIARRLGLESLQWLQPKSAEVAQPKTEVAQPKTAAAQPRNEPATCPEPAGSGIIGTLPAPETPEEFLDRIKAAFGVHCLMHSDTNRPTISKVALCGGSGAFLIDDAKAAGADCFITGEIHYHDFFENDGILLCALGHYESEQYTKDLLAGIITKSCPEIKVLETGINTNPIIYR